MIWSECEIKILEKLWKSGVTASAIGKRINKSKNGVIGKVRRLGLKKRPNPVVRKPALKPKIKSVEKVECFKVGKYNSLTDVPKNACLWPFGDPKESNFSYCGENTPESDYCEKHYKEAYRESTWKDMYKEPWQRKDV